MEIKTKSFWFKIYLNLINVFQKKHFDKNIKHIQLKNIKQKILIKIFFHGNSLYVKKKKNQLLKKEVFILNLVLLDNIKKDIFLCKLNQWYFIFKFIKEYPFYYSFLNQIFIIYKYFFILDNWFFWIFTKQIFIFVKLNLTKLINNMLKKNSTHCSYYKKRKIIINDSERNLKSMFNVNFFKQLNEFRKLKRFFNTVYTFTIKIQIIHRKLDNNLNKILNIMIKNKKVLHKYENI